MICRVSVGLELGFCGMSKWQHWYDSHRSNPKYYNNVGLHLYKDLTAKSSSWSWPLFGLVRWARGKCRASTCLCSTQWIRPLASNQKKLVQIASNIYSVLSCTEYAASQLLGPSSQLFSIILFSLIPFPLPFFDSSPHFTHTHTAIFIHQIELILVSRKPSCLDRTRFHSSYF